MRKKRQKERLPERTHPGDPEVEYCSPGSIEQELDMCETGSLRGDEIQFSHGVSADDVDTSERGADELMGQYRVDMAEENREGDEMSGDEHSSGFQGGEPELSGQAHLASGMPGDRSRRVEELEELDFLSREGEEGIPRTAESVGRPRRSSRAS